MAQREKIAPFKKFLAIGLILIAAQLAFIWYYSPPGKNKDQKAVIQQAMKKVSGFNDERRVSLAIQMYRTQHTGKLPDNLNQLVPEFLDSVPIDPVTGQPLAYKVESGKFNIGSGAAPTIIKDLSGNIIATSGREAEETVQAFLRALAESPNKSIPPYDPNKKRDPFRPFSFTDERTLTQAREPLQSFNLTDLKLTAVIEKSDAEPLAVLETNTSQGFTVRKGTKVGLHDGEIVEIHSDRVVVLETTTDMSGEKHNKTIEIYAKSKPSKEDKTDKETQRIRVQ